MGQRLIITEGEKNRIQSLYESMGIAFGEEMNGLKTKEETNERKKRPIRYLGQKRDDKDRWYDEKGMEYSGEFDFDYDEEEFDDYDTFLSKVPDQKFFTDPSPEDMFRMYREKFGPLKLRKKK
jgi:hypothetical protein